MLASTPKEMPMSYRITGLPAETFAPLFDLTDAELEVRGGVRRKASGREPCRVSLTDAATGDDLILVNYEHLPVASPYRMRYAVFVRRDEARFDQPDIVPEQLRGRTLAVRSFDSGGMNVAHDLVEGTALEGAIERLLADPAAAYLHIHYASAGCYAARVDRT
jgi:Protein of unknown function (DUF1203)